MANIQSPKRTIIAVNATGGAAVIISATQSDGYVEIAECPAEPYAGGAFTGQGLNYQRADENYANTYPLVPGQILQFGDAIRKNHSVGLQSFTYPDGTVRAATPFIKVTSATATPTQVMLSEWRQGIN